MYIYLARVLILIEFSTNKQKTYNKQTNNRQTFIVDLHDRNTVCSCTYLMLLLEIEPISLIRSSSNESTVWGKNGMERLLLSLSLSRHRIFIQWKYGVVVCI